MECTDTFFYSGMDIVSMRFGFKGLNATTLEKVGEVIAAEAIDKKDFVAAVVECEDCEDAVVEGDDSRAGLIMSTSRQLAPYCSTRCLRHS